jgi:hypothetical protein
MRDDGDIDYSKYTLLELEEALAGINKQQYPKNYANLCLAHEQLTANRMEAPQPEPPATESSATRRGPGMWEKLWDSRPVTALLGAFCLWWAYDIFTQPGSCHASRRLTGAIVKSICDNFGHEVAATIPFVLGIVLVVFAAFPRRPAGA